jgi:hypothetical protein
MGGTMVMLFLLCATDLDLLRSVRRLYAGTRPVPPEEPENGDEDDHPQDGMDDQAQHGGHRHDEYGYKDIEKHGFYTFRRDDRRDARLAICAPSLNRLAQ